MKAVAAPLAESLGSLLHGIDETAHDQSSDYRSKLNVDLS
jgi:hypothetical protein